MGANPATRQREMSERRQAAGEVSAAASGPAFAALVNSLIEQAPLLVRQKSLLPAFDWRQASAVQVDRLLTTLHAAGVKIPAWLARGILIAGHALPQAALGNAPEDLVLLQALNGVAGGGLPDGFARRLADYCQHERLDEAIAVAMVKRLVELGHAPLGCRVALSQAATAPAALSHVRKELETKTADLPAIAVRVAGTSTTHGIATALVPAFAAAGWRAAISEADFGTLVSELMNPAAEADALVVVLDRALLATLDWRSEANLSRGLMEDQIEAMIGAIKAYCGRRAGSILVNTLPVTALPAAGFMDRYHALGEAALVAEVNARLAKLASEEPRVILVDTDAALGAFAPIDRTDAKLWFYGRMAYSDEATRALARAYAQAWRAHKKGMAKVLALDFDNTLWGGVFGDDGIGRLACGDDFPGNAFKALQTECLRLKAQGMLLVALSKNNPDALDVFARHPGMALSREDFVATAVNWEPKPANVERIAKELGLGLDSFVFIDDSPHERAAMRQMCPAVTVPEMPSDPAKRPQWLRSLAATWPARLTGEDAQRSELYRNEQRRRELREAAGSFDAYLAGLEQSLAVAAVSDVTLARVAQLHQRTNQFNLTGLRLTEGDLDMRRADPGRHVVLEGRVHDRYGDHGLVLAASAAIDGGTATIESFVMSCRVIGRRVEAAFIDALMSRLAEQGVARVVGVFRPSSKNGVAREVYASLGFTPVGATDEAELWEADVDGDLPARRSHGIEITWGELT